MWVAALYRVTWEDRAWNKIIKLHVLKTFFTGFFSISNADTTDTKTKQTPETKGAMCHQKDDDDKLIRDTVTDHRLQICFSDLYWALG